MILSIVSEISGTSSRLSKEKILNREINNDLLRDAFKAAYDPYVNYWIAKIPEYVQGDGNRDLQWGLSRLDALSSRKYTGHEGIRYLADTLGSLSEDAADILKRVVERDLRCGVGVSTINKIWSGLIKTFEVCLAHHDISGIRYPALAQVKYDGGRCHLYFDGEKAIAYSRSGRVIELHGALDTCARRLMAKGDVLDGEIVFRDPDGELLDRKTSNGLFNKGVKGTISADEAANATFICWDLVDFSSTVGYSDRFGRVVKRWEQMGVDKKSCNIWMAEEEVVNSEEEAIAFYEKCIENKHEGAVIKNTNFLWQPKRIKDIGKMKACEEADLVAVAWHHGTGKNASLMGAITVETSDGGCRCNVGTGWSDEERQMTPDEILGKIVTVQYNQKIKDRNRDTWSLYLPRAIEVRLDKTVPNSTDELK